MCSPRYYVDVAKRFSTELVSAVGVKIIGGGVAGDDVFFFGPCAKINLFATFGTKRAPAIRFFPFNLAGTRWAIDDRYHRSEFLEIAQREFKRHITLIHLGLHIATLGGKAYPQDVFVS